MEVSFRNLLSLKEIRLQYSDDDVNCLQKIIVGLPLQLLYGCLHDDIRFLTSHKRKIKYLSSPF